MGSALQFIAKSIVPVPEWNTCGFVTDKFVASTRRAFVSRLYVYCRLHKNGVNGTEAEKYVTTGRFTLGKPGHLRDSPRKWSKSLFWKRFQPSYERCMWAVTNDRFLNNKEQSVLLTDMCKGLFH